MNLPIAIGLGAGLVAAVLFLSTATGSILAMMLFFAVSLPGFIAGLGWGTLSALISALAAAGVVALVTGPATGLVYFLSLGLPVVLLCYLALLARPADESGPEGQPKDLEWYPPGRLAAWTTLLAGGFAALSVPFLGFSAESYRGAAKKYFDTTIFSRLPTNGQEAVDRTQIEPVIDLLVQLLPATMAIVWLAIMLLNMWAAQRIVATSGRAIRPTPPVADMTFPRHFPLGFFAALLGTFLPGIAGIIAMGFAGAFLLAYVLMGLAVLHVLARKAPAPSFLLAILYMALMLFSFVALAVAVIGLAEPVFKLRERAQNKPQPPDRTNG